MAFIRKKIKSDGTPSWRVVFKDQYGRRRELAAGSTKKSAELLRGRVEKELAEGIFEIVRPEDPPFSKFCEDFLAAKKTQVKASTFLDCERVIKNHINPYFGRTRLSEMNPIGIKSFLEYLQDKGLSAATTGKVFRYLKLILRYALTLELIDRDPTQALRPPRIVKEEMDFLTPQEMQQLLAATTSTIKCLIATACYAGLRQGEILGLKWKDIDWEHNSIRVVRTYHYAHGFSEPKTPSSRRAVPIVGPLKEMLLNYYEAKPGKEPEYLVFPNSKGKPRDRRNLVTRDFEKALEAAHLRKIRFHDLRHSYASLCIAAKMDPKAIQTAMGHSSIRVTLDIYGHLFPGSYDDSMERLAGIINLES